MNINTRKDLRKWIEYDRRRYNYTIMSYIKGLILSNDNSHAIRLLKRLRITEFYCNNKNKGIWYRLLFAINKVLYCRLQFRYDTYIGINTCGPGLWIPHMGGVIVNCRKMGENCSLTKGVVIGNRSGQDNRATIGDNCYFTLGCKVIGSVNIGDNVIVAQNAVVTKDIESNTLVGGIPAKPIKKYKTIADINI